MTPKWQYTYLTLVGNLTLSVIPPIVILFGKSWYWPLLAFGKPLTTILDTSSVSIGLSDGVSVVFLSASAKSQGLRKNILLYLKSSKSLNLLILIAFGWYAHCLACATLPSPI